MTNLDIKALIAELRDQADVLGAGTECHLLRTAADVIESMDERIAIMSVEHMAEAGKTHQEEAAKWLEYCLIGRGCSLDCPYYDGLPSVTGCVKSLATDVLSLIKEPRGARVMDRIELNLMHYGDACWLEMRDCSWPAWPGAVNQTGWVIIRQVDKVQSKDDWCWYFGTPLHPNTLPLLESTYGVEWRCWSAKPTDEQRKVVKWG